MMPRKNGKTELCAALAIDGLLFDNETGAEVYSAANDRDQASLCFNVAAQMIRNDPELLAACDIVDSQKRIVHRKSGSVYRAISAESFTKHGINASRVIYDELHAAPTRDLWDVLATSTGARAQPLVIAISTAGYDRHSILWELYQHGKQVQETPAIDPSFLPVIYEAPGRCRLARRSGVAEGQPGAGRFPLARGAAHRPARGRRKSRPRRTPSGASTSTSGPSRTAAGLSMAAWDACQAPSDLAALAGRRCYVGLDLSTTTDLTAAVAVFPDDDGPGFTVLPQFFVPGRAHPAAGDPGPGARMTNGPGGTC